MSGSAWHDFDALTGWHLCLESPHRGDGVWRATMHEEESGMYRRSDGRRVSVTAATRDEAIRLAVAMVKEGRPDAP